MAVIRLDTVDTYKRFHRNMDSSEVYSYVADFFQSALLLSLNNTARSKLIAQYHIKFAIEAASRWLEDNLHDGVIFRTKFGFFGVALANLRNGDEVVVAEGASAPFVLRSTSVFEKAEDYSPLYELVGE